jgi:hypothetical protein
MIEFRRVSAGKRRRRRNRNRNKKRSRKNSRSRNSRSRQRSRNSRSRKKGWTPGAGTLLKGGAAMIAIPTIMTMLSPLKNIATGSAKALETMVGGLNCAIGSKSKEEKKCNYGSALMGIFLVIALIYVMSSR